MTEKSNEMTSKQIYDLEVQKRNDERSQKMCDKKQMFSLILAKVNSVITSVNQEYLKELSDIVRQMNKNTKTQYTDDIEKLKAKDKELSNERMIIQTQIEELGRKNNKEMEELISEKHEREIFVQYGQYHFNSNQKYNTIRDYGPESGLIELSKHLEIYKDNDKIKEIILSAIGLLATDENDEIKKFMTM